MPFSHGLVYVGDEPAPVAEPIVKALQRQVAEIWEAGGLDPLDLDIKPGDWIRVRQGMFEGYEGIFDLRLTGQERARVLLKMVHDRYMPAELDLAAIEKEVQGSGLRH